MTESGAVTAVASANSLINIVVMIVLYWILSGVKAMRRPFIDRYIDGESSEDDIDNEVDAWHDGAFKGPIHRYLGMTLGEYGGWIEGNLTLEDIATSRRRLWDRKK